MPHDRTDRRAEEALNRPDNRVALFLDYENVRHSLEHNFDPAPSPQGASRRIDVSDDPTSFFYLGADLFLTEHWAAQLYYREIDMNIDAEFYYIEELRDSGTFPMSSTWWGIGVKYQF